MTETLKCPECGKTFTCNPDGDCWCKSYPVVKIPDKLKGKSCLCRCQLDKLHQEQHGRPLMQKIMLPAILIAALVGVLFFVSGCDSENNTEAQEAAQPSLDCGDGSVGEWSSAANADGTLCGHVTNEAGVSFFILKGNDYFHTRLSGLTPNAPYSIVARTNGDLLFRVDGEADPNGDFVIDLGATQSRRIINRLRRDRKLSLLPRDKDSPQAAIHFPLKGSGKALKIFGLEVFE